MFTDAGDTLKVGRFRPKIHFSGVKTDRAAVGSEWAFMKNDWEIKQVYRSGVQVHWSGVRIDWSFMKIHWEQNKIYRSGAQNDRADVADDWSGVKIDRVSPAEGRGVPRGWG